MNVNNFDVLKRMSAENQKIMMATGSNVLQMQKVRAGTQITIGVEGDVISSIYNGDLGVCLLLFDRKQFNETKAQMEAEEG